MKYIKRFNESLSDIQSNFKFCGECGEKLDKAAYFCGECGTKQEELSSSQKEFTISGKIESSYPNGQKTPIFTLSSMNKTLSGTNIIFDKGINKFDIPVGQEVSITGTTEDGLSPKFNNPIIVSDIKKVFKK